MFPHIRFLQLTVSGHAHLASLERLHAASHAGTLTMQDSDELQLYLQASVELPNACVDFNTATWNNTLCAK
jgi:hypothetical protein